MATHKSVQNAITIFRRHGGTLRTAEALRLGIHSRTLYAMRDSGVLERLSRGLYRLAELPPLSNPDLVTVAPKVPQAVVCLVSALAFHELTTQIPHAVDIALHSRADCPGFSPARIARLQPRKRDCRKVADHSLRSQRWLCMNIPS